MNRFCPSCKEKTLKQDHSYLVIDSNFGHYYYCNDCDIEVVCDQCAHKNSDMKSGAYRFVHNLDYHSQVNIS